MMKKNARFNYLICIYLAGIIFFTLFRIAETVAYCATTEGPDDFGGLYWKALWIGFRFDTTVSTYILTLPLLMIIIGEMARIKKRWYYAIAHYYMMVLYTICFFACAADIPYFCYFFQRLDAAALGLTSSFGMAVSMIVHEPTYIAYFFVFLAVSVAWWLLGRLIFRRVLMAHIDEHLTYGWGIPVALVLIGVGFLGMRGRISKKCPIRVGTAYFCSNPFLNQIGLNPLFSFFKSIEDAGKSANRQVDLIDLATAQAVLEEQRALPEDDTLPEASLQLPKGTNVVLVLMESMSYDKTGLYNPTTSLTPCLDNLMRRSMTFGDTWSSGIHTHNGIYTTLYSHPAIMSRQMIKNTPIPNMCGLPHQLRDAGYRTFFFSPHDALYDNMKGFLYANGFDRVIDEQSYPRKEVLSTWGIPDHALFDHTIEHIDSIAAGGPFFVTVLTCSDHAPYALPEGIDFRPKNKNMEKLMVEYADWSIGRFVDMVEKKPWFDNTLFVFIADHGATMNVVYDLSLAYNHVPLLFFAPKHLPPHFVERLAMQGDVAPTILGLLGIDASDRMLGENLMTHNRKYAYFSADDKIGVVDGELFYLYRAKQEKESLYRYQERDTVDLIKQYPERAQDMRRHAFGMIQMAQQMLLDGTTKCDCKEER